MARLFLALLLTAGVATVSFAQQTTLQDSLLDQMAGKWVLEGAIAGQKTTHDVDAQWVLAHEYLQIHEVSREKDSTGAPAYEAIVYIGADQPPGEFACLWLDVTGGGGLNGQAIGHGKRNGNQIAFLFKGGDGSLFHTTFIHDAGNDTWQWVMDGEENGELHPFARVTLRRSR